MELRAPSASPRQWVKGCERCKYNVASIRSGVVLIDSGDLAVAGSAVPRTSFDSEREAFRGEFEKPGVGR